jgi:hypothetical protein
VKSTLLKHELKAEEYRARAREAFAAADGETLDRVRELRRAAAATWTDLADAEDVRAVGRRARLAETSQ